MSKIHMGIDVGGKGGIALFTDKVLSQYMAFPKTKDDRPDIHEFVIWLSSCIDKSGGDIFVAFEDLHSIFGSSAASNFQFGWINGAIEACLIAFCIPFVKIQPKKWQKEMWEGIRPVEIPSMEKKLKGQPAVQKRNKDGSPKYKTDTKATSLLAAKRLFPKETFLASKRSSVPHDGIVDAVLIGAYCSRHY